MRVIITFWKLVCFLSLCSSTFSSPIVIPFENDYDGSGPFIGSDFCLLPPELGYEGNVTFVEDCNSLDRFDTVPLPGDFYRKLGTHPMVCCPKHLPDSHICFESDPWCPTYKEPEFPQYDYAEDTLGQQISNDNEYGDIPIVTNPTILAQEIPKMADRECGQNGQYQTYPEHGELSQCVPLDQCGKILDNDHAPQNQTVACGFDEKRQVMMICCPEAYVTEPQSLVQNPRFPVKNGNARNVEDKVDQCRKWRNNEGCSLDKDLVISKIDPTNGKVISKVMFDFMQGACMKSCGWASNKGCVDEHPRCPAWARKGMCIINPLFMTHTCRESCGVCGFLSADSKEEQEVDGLSYTDFTRDNFDCGRYKPLCEINKEDCEATEAEPIDNDLFDLREDETTTQNSEVDDDVFFSSDLTGDGEYFCGATMVTDRWVVAAAHCYDEFQVSADNKPRQVKINTIRDNTKHIEIVEIKKIYKHPLYKYPSLYDDIAVLELGRRVEYNFEMFGDTPSCIDQGQDNVGKIATIQGYGLTEHGERGELLETNVTVITNEVCKEYLDFNATDRKNIRSKIDNALPFGLKYGLLCAQGDINEEGVFKGSCAGDSGGPLTAPNDADRTTLIGIVSGGIGCGKGYPGWYTRVSFHTKWIRCIINTSLLYNNHEKVSKACEKAVNEPPKCATANDLIFGDTDTADSDVEICNNGQTSGDDYDLRQPIV